MSEQFATKKTAKNSEIERAFGLLGITDASDDTSGDSDTSCDSDTDDGDGAVCPCGGATVIEATYPRITIAEQAQIARIPGIAQRLSTCETKIGTLESTVAANKQECLAAHETMNTNIAANTTAITAEKTRAEGVETTLNTAIGLKADKTTVTALETKVDAEITNRGTAVTNLTTRVAAVETSVTTEKTNRETADNAIRNDVNVTVGTIYTTLRGEAASQKTVLEGEIADAKTDVTTKVTTEETQRKAEDATLLQKITDETTARTNKDSELTTLISTKETSLKSGYQTADSALQTQITTNANTISANRTLFDNTKTALETADATLTANLATEVTNRENGDTTTLATAKAYAKSLLSSALRYQGQVATLSDLEAKTATATKGDMWNVLNDGEGLAANYAFNGTGWDRLTESIDLSPYATITYVDGKVTTLTNKDTELNGKIEANTLKINTDVAAEKSRAQTAETMLQSNIDTEELARETKDDELTTSLNTLSGKVTTETARIEALIASTASTKEQSAISRENAIKAELAAKDDALELSINALSGTVGANKTAIENSLAQEVTDRTNAVTELKNELTVTDISGTSRLVGMGEVLSKIGQKQDILQSGINIKTINSQSILGSGNLQITAETAFVMNMSYNSATSKMEFDVTAEEVKAAIDNDDDIVIVETVDGNTLTHRKCLVDSDTDSIKVYAFSENDGNAQMISFTIAKVSGAWTYSGDIQTATYDLNTFKAKLAGSTGTLKNVEDSVTTLQGTVGGLQTTVGGLQTTVGGHTTSIESLTTRIGTAEGDITALDEGKVSKSGDTMSGDLTMGASNAIVFGTPVGLLGGYNKSITKTGVVHSVNGGDYSYTVAWPSASGTFALTSDITTAIADKADKATTLSGYGITDAYTKTETDTAVSNLDTKVGKIFSEGNWGTSAVAGQGISIGGKRATAYKIQLWNKNTSTFIGWYYTRLPELGAYFATSIANLEKHVMAGKYTSYNASRTSNFGVLNDGTEVVIKRQYKGTIIDETYDTIETNVVSFTELRRIEALEYELEQSNSTIEALTTRIAALEALFNTDNQLLIKNEDASKTYALGIEQDAVSGDDTLVITEQS